MDVRSEFKSANLPFFADLDSERSGAVPSGAMGRIHLMAVNIRYEESELLGKSPTMLTHRWPAQSIVGEFPNNTSPVIGL
jgi:hypothetical protein